MGDKQHLYGRMEPFFFCSTYLFHVEDPISEISCGFLKKKKIAVGITYFYISSLSKACYFETKGSRASACMCTRDACHVIVCARYTYTRISAPRLRFLVSQKFRRWVPIVPISRREALFLGDRHDLMVHENRRPRAMICDSE